MSGRGTGGERHVSSPNSPLPLPPEVSPRLPEFSVHTNPVQTGQNLLAPHGLMRPCRRLSYSKQHPAAA